MVYSPERNSLAGTAPTGNVLDEITLETDVHSGRRHTLQGVKDANGSSMGRGQTFITRSSAVVVRALVVLLCLAGVGAIAAHAQSAAKWDKRGAAAEARQDYDAALEGMAAPERRAVEITLLPNPSHLEVVNPVLEGVARALERDGTVRDGSPSRDEMRVVPVCVHGDAAFPGEGIVPETFNLSRLPGYRVGGTVLVFSLIRWSLIARHAAWAYRFARGRLARSTTHASVAMFEAGPA